MKSSRSRRKDTAGPAASDTSPAEAHLRESEERLAAIFNGSSNALAFTEPTLGRIIDVNATWVRLMGVPRDEALGRTALELGLWSDPADRESCLATLADSGRLSDVEVSLVTVTGPRPFLASAGRVTIRDVDYLLWEFRDIQHLKQARQEQDLLRTQLFQAQKMEAFGQMAGGIAHDFNNLLQVMIGNAEIAAMSLDPGHPSQTSLADLATAAERAATLVGQLLLFSRRQIMRPDALDLNDVISQLLTMLTRIIGEHIRVEFVAGERMEPVWADRAMIEQVLLNLCVNARDAMGSEGTLTIRTGSVHADRDLCAPDEWASPGPHGELSVSDTGSGMDARTLSRIFEPFFTTKGRHKGTGLGLSVVYGIVRQHRGMIRVSSKPGEGTTFRVYLPVTAQQGRKQSALGDAPPAGGTETILVAEDDDGVRRLVTRALTSAGYRVIEAADGQEAARIVGERGKDIDLLLLDVVMPHMGGREVYDRAQKIRPGLPALFTSGYSEDAIHKDFVLETGVNLIQKPYAAADMLREVRRILDAGPGRRRSSGPAHGGMTTPAPATPNRGGRDGGIET